MRFQHRTGLLLAAVVTLLVGLVGSQAVLAQEPVVRVQPPIEELREDGGEFDVEVVVDNVSDLGGFQFTLGFDPAVLEFVDVAEGPFLGSSGRDVRCLDPRVTDNSVSFVCVTLGAVPAEGATGSGQLARVSFSPRGGGESPLGLSDVKLVLPPGDPIPNTNQDGSVFVVAVSGGFRWVIWGPVIGVGALVLLAVGVLIAGRVRIGGLGSR